MQCSAVQRELSCVWMQCGAACGQGLRMQRSMRMHFLLSAPSLMQILVATLRGAVHQQQRTAAYAALLPSLEGTGKRNLDRSTRGGVLEDRF